jgi:hypothetical protein
MCSKVLKNLSLCFLSAGRSSLAWRKGWACSWWRHTARWFLYRWKSKKDRYAYVICIVVCIYTYTCIDTLQLVTPHGSLVPVSLKIKEGQVIQYFKSVYIYVCVYMYIFRYICNSYWWNIESLVCDATRLAGARIAEDQRGAGVYMLCIVVWYVYMYIYTLCASWYWVTWEHYTFTYLTHLCVFSPVFLLHCSWNHMSLIMSYNNNEICAWQILWSGVQKKRSQCECICMIYML